MAELIASRYSTALFDAGTDLDKVELFYDELKVLEVAFKDEEKLLQILSHPKVSNREKKELLDKIFKERISDELLNFLYILIDKNRQDNLFEMIEIYEDLFYEYKGIVRVVAITAMPMEDDAKKRLTEALSKKLNKEIEISNEIDKSTIGGIKLELEGKLIDGTIEGKLKSMARTLKTAMN